MRPRPMLLAATLTAMLSGCRGEMYDQPRYEAYSPSDLNANGSAMLPPQPGTVARGALEVDTHLHDGRVDGKDAADFPFAVTEADVARGQHRYMIYCTPCHGYTGDGDGMIVRRGFSPPPSFHEPRLREEPPGHFYRVIKYGHGAMYSYAARVPTRDRWLITAYIRALQLSQNAPVADLPPDDRRQVEESAR